MLPVDGPGEVRTVATMPDGASDLRWSPDGRWLAFTSRARDARYEAEDERWQSPRKIERFFSRLDNEGWVFDRPNHVYVVAADGTGKPRDLTPGPFQHGGIAWLPDSSGVVTAAARHDTWDLDLCEDLYVVPLDGSDPRPHQADGRVPPARRVARRHPGRVPRRRRPDDVPPEHARRRDLRRWWRAPLDLDRAGPHVRDDGREPGAAVARRRHALGHRRGPRRDPPLPAGRRRVRRSGGADQRADHDPRLRRRGWSHRHGPLDRRPPGRDRHARRSRDQRDRELPRVGAVRRPDDRRHRRDRRLDHAPGRLRVTPQVPGAAQRARRTVHPVRRDVLRRGPDAGGGRVRRADVQPARRQRPRHGVGAVDPRPEAPRRAGNGLGHGRRRRRAGRARRHALARYPFCDPKRVGMLGGSYGGYMATLLAGLPRRPVPPPSAASGPSTT